MGGTGKGGQQGRQVKNGIVQTSEGSWHQGAGGHTGRKWTRQGLHQRFHWGLGCDPNSPRLSPGGTLSGALSLAKAQGMERGTRGGGSPWG